MAVGLTTVLSDPENSILNFSKSRRIQANIIENYLFFTDGYNEPRKIDTTQDYEIGGYNANDITVAKLAPQFAPQITVLDTSETAGNYIEEKFVRFAYRYKFYDNTYSVYSPFSNTVFKVNNEVLTEEQIQDAYSKGELDFLINTAKTINIQPKTPDGGSSGWSNLGIKQIDILLKASNSPAVLLLDSLKGTSLNSPFTYNSEKPKSTLPEDQLIRVYDNVPRAALAQEIVGNRIVYGNFVQGFDIDTTTKLPFTLTTAEKTLDGTYLDALGVKSNRTYEIGIVFSDEYGRTSPVIFGENKSIYLNRSVQDNYNKNIAIQFNDPLDLTALTDAGFYYYSVVVKQSEQEYYNIYTPGFGNVDGRSYFSLFGDNINKIPIDPSAYNTETNVNTTSTKLYLALENKAITNSSDANLDISFNSATLEAFKYTVRNTSGSTSGYISNITNVVAYTGGTGFTQTITSANCTIGQNKLAPAAPDGTTATFAIAITSHNAITATTLGSGFTEDTANNIGLSLALNTGVDVYVDGVKKVYSVDYTYNKSASPNPTITFTSGNIPKAGEQIAVFFKYSNVPAAPLYGPYDLLSLSTITGDITITEGLISYDVTIPRVSDEALISPTIAFEEANLKEIKITGISTRNNFGPLADSEDVNSIYYNSVNTTDLRGLYKVDSNYLLAEVDGIYGVRFYDSAPSPANLKYADLAILETKGFDSAIDIYYETATQGTISSITAGSILPINYYNCINLKTPVRDGDTNIIWQESRIKGGFNEPSMDYGVQAYFSDEDYGLSRRESSLIYSGILNNNTRVNNTNQFPSGENISSTLDPSYGSIQKLYADTDDLLILQEEKISQALIDKDIIYTAEGQGLTTAGRQVISQINAFSTNYGIGTNPESFAVYGGRKYFVDKPKGSVLRLSRDGITEISNYGMRSYFREKLSGEKSAVIGFWDIYNKEYVLSIQDSEPEGENITLGFDESNNGWVSRYSYIPEDGGSLDGNFYTFKGGNLYVHNINGLYNNFYGTQYDSEVTLIFNQNPSANKNFLTINYEGSNTWNISNITTDIDAAEDIAAYNVVNEDLIISGFKKYDNKYFANIINAGASLNTNEIVLGKDMAGIKGYFAEIKIKTSATDYKELFSVSTNYNINSY